METCDIDFDDSPEVLPPEEPTAPPPRPARPFLRLPPAEPKRKPWERRERDDLLPRYEHPQQGAAPGRVPPHSVEAEEQLLSACLLDGGDVVRRCKLGGIKVPSFYVPANRVIYDKLLELEAKGLPIDLAVLGQELKDTRTGPGQTLLDEIGGYVYLTRISGRIPTTAGAAYFIEKVKELARLRDIIRAATGTVENAYNYSGDMAEVTAPLDVVFEEQAGLMERLDACAIRHDKPPAPAHAIFGMGKAKVSTQGNITAIIAQAKAGKTTLVGGALTAVLLADGLAQGDVDCLGWWAVPTKGRAIIYFDTELSPNDHWEMMDRVVRRAKAKTMPPNLWNRCVTGWQAREIREAVRAMIEKALRQGTEIYAVILDGVADLCADVNDAEESNSLVAELHMLAITAKAPVICVMHRNEGDKADSAARGHLGKQLARKAETNLRLEQKDGVSYVFADRNRGAPIKEDEGPAFKWNDHSMMHRSITPEEKAQFHRERAEANAKPTRAKREPKEDRPERINGKWSEEELLSLFPFGEKDAIPHLQMAKRAMSAMGMPAGTFAAFRTNLLFSGQIQKTGHADDLRYYR